MYSGGFDRKVTIESATEGRDGVGGVTFTWATLATVWAKKIPVTGREFYASQASQMVGSELVRWQTHYFDAAMNTKLRVNDGGKIYDVRSVAELGRREGIELVAEYVQGRQ